MPNWCMTTVLFYGDEDKVKTAQAEMEQVYNKEREKHGNLADYGNWLGYLVEDILKKDPDSKDSPRCRGTWEILDTDNPTKDIYELKWFTESAWNPCYALMYELAKHFKLDLAWISEEPGMADYMSYDPDGYAGFGDSTWHISFDPDEVELDGATDLYDEMMFYSKEALCDSWLGEKAGVTMADTADEIVSKLKNLNFYADPTRQLLREEFEELATNEI